MATNTGKFYVDALAAVTPWTDGLNLDVFFESGAGGAWNNQEQDLFVSAFQSPASVANIGLSIRTTRAGAELAERMEADSTWTAPAPNADQPYDGNFSVSHELGGVPAPSDANLVIGYTPPSPLPDYTASQIVQALRTSWLGPANANNDYPQDTRTFTWATNLPITYRLVTAQTVVTNTNGTATTADDTTTTRANMSVQEQTRIAEALEIWDDFIDIDINNDQLAGTAGHPTAFFDIFYVSTGTASTDGTQNGDTSGRAFANYTTTQALPGTNEYGTGQVRIDNAVLNLGRSFNSGELDGRVGNGGAVDGGVDDLSYGKRGFETVMHEIGHGLGLSHPGFYNFGQVTPANGQLFAQDSLRNTIMSYNSEVSATTNFRGINASTPMIYDILAIQTIYGTDTVTRTGGNTYGFNNNTGRGAYDFRTNLGSVFTIWDAGGTDAIDASGFTGSNTINLAAGSLSSIGRSGGNTGAQMLENVGIAFGVTIENAIGGSGADIINGNGVGNTLTGNAGADTLNGRDGADRLVGGIGSDNLNGGDGLDIASYIGATSAIDADLTAGKVADGHGGTDTLVEVEDLEGSAFGDRMRGDGQGNLLYGAGGNDTVDGSAGHDVLKGGGGDDVLIGGSGADDLYGDDSTVDVGLDTASYATAAAGVVVDMLNAAANTGDAAGDTLNSIENLAGSAFADSLRGNNSANVLEGGAGADALNGAGGSDTASYASSSAGVAADLGLGKYLYGDAQDDTLVSIENLTGSAFDDDLRGNANANTLRGLAGNDDLYGGAFDLLEGGLGNDYYVVDSDFAMVREAVGQGYDTVVASATFRLSQGLAEVELLTTNDSNGTAAINLYGSNHSNTLIGNAGNNVLDGRLGNDFLQTGAGADAMVGGDGFDTIVFHKAMVADWQAGVLDADIASDSWASWESIQGSAGADRIRTNSWGFAVELRGGGGDDVLATGVTGVVGDFLSGQSGDDKLDGGAGNDQLAGGADNDTVGGGTGDDTAGGGSGDDRLFGGFGDDVLSGGLGRDVMAGSGGADRFDFNSVAEIGTGATSDLISGFTHADLLDISGIDARPFAGNQAFDFLDAKGAAFSSAGQARFRQAGGNTFVDLNTDHDLTTIEATIKLAGLTTLVDGDFVL